MAVTKIDKLYGTFSVGEIIVGAGLSQKYGVKVLKSAYIANVGDTFIVQYGQVKNNAFVGDKKYGSNEADLSIMTVKQLRDGYYAKWTKDEFSAKAGDILKDQIGKTYIVADDNTTWSINDGTHSTLAYWQREGKVFEHFKTASGHHYSQYLDVKSTW